MREYKKSVPVHTTLFLICIVSLAIAFTFLADNFGYFSLRDLFTSVLSTENIVSLTNEARVAAGLTVLKIDPKLEFAAQQKAEDMLKNQYFSHASPFGKVAWDFIEDTGYNYLFAGENLAIHFNSAEDLAQGWLASLKHKENILSNKYTQIGIGISTGKFFGVNTTVVVQMFGKPLKSSALLNYVASTIERSQNSRVPKLPTAAVAPTVKGASIKKYIEELESSNVAQWIPMANTHQLYAFYDTVVPTKTVFDIVFLTIFVSGAGVFAYRFFKKKTIRRKH